MVTLLVKAVAAVNVDGLAGDEARRRARQVGDRLDDVLGPAAPPDGLPADDLFEQLAGGVLLPGALGLDEAGGHAVDGDAVRAGLAGQRAREAHDAGLARDVGRHL